MLGKYILCFLTAASLPVYAQTASETVQDEQASAGVENSAGIVLPDGLAESDPELASWLNQQVANNPYMRQDDIDVLIAVKTGNDNRSSSGLAGKYDRDVNLHPYEAQLVYRQMIRNERDQENKEKALKTMAKVYGYTDEQMEKAAALYESEKPVEYNMPDLGNEEVMDKFKNNPSGLMQDLSTAAKFNKNYAPQELDKSSDASDKPDVVAHTLEQAVMKPSNPQDVKEAPQRIMSVQALTVSDQPEVKRKRLGVKSYGINPDNFY